MSATMSLHALFRPCARNKQRTTNAPQQCGNVDMIEPLGHAQIEDQPQNCACGSMPIHNVNAVFQATRYFRCSNEVPAMKHKVSFHRFQAGSILLRLCPANQINLLKALKAAFGAASISAPHNHTLAQFAGPNEQRRYSPNPLSIGCRTSAAPIPTREAPPRLDHRGG